MYQCSCDLSQGDESSSHSLRRIISSSGPPTVRMRRKCCHVCIVLRELAGWICNYAPVAISCLVMLDIRIPVVTLGDTRSPSDFNMPQIHPIDLTKVRMQLLGEGGKGPKMNPATVALTVIREEGVQALYAGLSAALMRQAVYGTARIGLHREFSNLLKDWQKVDALPVHLKVASSMTSGAIASFIGNPFDVSLVRMQADGMRPAAERRGYSNVFDALMRITREEGLFRLWRGCEPTILRAMAMNVGMMASYDQFREMITAVNGDNFGTQLMSSAAAGVTCAVFSLPFDLIKTRLQNMRPDAAGKFPYKGVVDCATKVVTQEGPLALWRGLSAYYLRCAPHAMIILLTLEQINRAYSSFFGTTYRK